MLYCQLLLVGGLGVGIFVPAKEKHNKIRKRMFLRQRQKFGDNGGRVRILPFCVLPNFELLAERQSGRLICLVFLDYDF
jgi:hypothetical protein